MLEEAPQEAQVSGSAFLQIYHQSLKLKKKFLSTT